MADLADAARSCVFGDRLVTCSFRKSLRPKLTLLFVRAGGSKGSVTVWDTLTCSAVAEKYGKQAQAGKAGTRGAGWQGNNVQGGRAGK
jgi:hypothetical protein